MQLSRRSWAVIGGGPCGIATVGRLLDFNQSVTWIDPSFQSGRMGKFYRRVPANALNGDLLIANRFCKSFQFDSYQDIRRRRYFVDSLEDMTTELLPKVNSIHGYVRSLQKTSATKQWKLEVERKGNKKVSYVDGVINVSGCKPKPLPDFPLVEENQSPVPITLSNGRNALVHSLDQMVDPIDCQAIRSQYPSTDKWLVVGDSHSGMLVVKNLVEGRAVKNVVNMFRSPLRFMYVTPNGSKKHQGIGLKGPVGDWVKENVTDNNEIVTRIQYDSSQSWDEQLSTIDPQHIIVAYGFIRDDNFPISVDDYTLSTKDLDNYDKWTGEVKIIRENGNEESIGLFGGGIASPQNYLDDENEVEPWVGFKRSVEQTDLIVEAFEKSLSTQD
eukprot:gene14304-15819_t